MKEFKNKLGEVNYDYRDENLLAYMGNKKKLVKILSTTESGAVVAYEIVNKPENVFNPLIKKGKNVEQFIILGNQLKLF